jgi:hypothetical protein
VVWSLQMNLLGSEGMVDAVLQNLHSWQETDLSTTGKLLDVIAYNTAINSCVQAKKVCCKISEGRSFLFVSYRSLLSSYRRAYVYGFHLSLSIFTWIMYILHRSTKHGIYSWK